MALRLFVGVELDEAARAALSQAVARVRERPAELRFLHEDSWHVTLQFLGSVEEAQLDVVRAAVQRAASSCTHFALELGTGGAFPATRKARVLWVGFTQGEAQLAAACDAVHAQTEPLGFAREDREFRPHVTLARVKPPADVRAVLSALHVPRVRMTAQALTLFRSHLGSDGARYEALERAPLATAP